MVWFIVWDGHGSIIHQTTDFWEAFSCRVAVKDADGAAQVTNALLSKKDEKE